LEVGAEGEFKLDLRQDCDPGKQKLKGAVRTETYQRHYCQHILFHFLYLFTYLFIYLFMVLRTQMLYHLSFAALALFAF
jgi:hypothetical protein